MPEAIQVGTEEELRKLLTNITYRTVLGDISFKKVERKQLPNSFAERYQNIFRHNWEFHAIVEAQCLVRIFEAQYRSNTSDHISGSLVILVQDGPNYLESPLLIAANIAPGHVYFLQENLKWLFRFLSGEYNEHNEIINERRLEIERERKVEALIKSLEQMATATAQTSDAARFRSILNSAAQTIEGWGRMIRKEMKSGAAPKEVVAKLLDGFDYKAQEILDALDETTPSKTGPVIK